MSKKEASEIERSYRMRELGYATPDDYNEMNDQQLEVLAEKHDVAALLQLADRSWWSGSGDSVDENLDKERKKIAIEYFMRAANGGVIKVTGVVAQLTLNSDDMVEAAAWNIAAAHLKQPVDSAAAKSKFKNLTYAQQNDAFIRAENITAFIGNPISNPSVGILENETNQR